MDVIMLYKYVGHEDSKELDKILKYFVEDGTIRATCPHDFNDPAEFKVRMDFEADEPEISKRFYDFYPNDSEDECKRWVNQQLGSNGYEAYQMRGNLLLSTGVICLTNNPYNYLMWSHYAKSHSGFCIGFDDDIVNLLDGDDFFASGLVNYSSLCPVVNFYNASQEEFCRALLFNKSDCWEYEAEFRIVSTRHGIKKFDKSLIKEITIGCRPDHELTTAVLELIDSEIEIYKMKCPPGTYQLEKVRLEKNTFSQGY